MLAVGIGFSSAAIIFVLLVFEGVRVSAANNVLFLSALTINLLGFVLALSERSKSLMVVSGLFSVCLFLAVIWGAMECFCMGGGCSNRFENCSGTRTPYVGLLNAFVLAAHRFQDFVAVAVSVLFALPALAWYVQISQSRAIQSALESHDLHDGCIIRIERLTYGLPEPKQAERISSRESISLAVFQGEGLPRFVVLKNDELLIWKYSLKRFVPMPRSVQELRATEFIEFCKS